jgi:peptide/nickel transport system substrate-binding protein
VLKRSWLLLTVAMVLALACGPAQQAPTPGTSEEPKAGGVLKTRVIDDPFDWDITYVGRSNPNSDGLALAYNSLLGYKHGPGVPYDELVLKDELADRWEVSPDAKTFTFQLKRGVRFADLPPVNGRDLTSADVKWTYEYGARFGDFKKLPQAQFETFFEGLQRIETPDPYTVTIQFKEPFVPFLNYAASDFNPIMPKEIYEQEGHLKDRIVGTGGLQLDAATVQKGTRWVWKKNPTSYEAGKVHLNEVQWLVLPDDTTGIAAKQLDLLGTRLSAAQADEIKKNNPDAVMYEFVYNNPQHVWLNTRKAPLDDVRVRRAIAKSVDRDEFMKVLSGGKGEWALAGAFPDTYSKEEVRTMLRPDPAEARRLLTEAGHPNGIDVELTFAPSGNQYQTLLELFQAQLKKGGVNLVFKSLDKEAESTRRKDGDYIVNIVSGVPLEGDVDSYLFTRFHMSSRNNYAGLTDPKLMGMLEGQRREGDPAKRQKIVREAVQYINEMVYNLALTYPPGFQFWHPYVKNYAPHAGSRGLPLTEAWLDR